MNTVVSCNHVWQPLYSLIAWRYLKPFDEPRLDYWPTQSVFFCFSLLASLHKFPGVITIIILVQAGLGQQLLFGGDCTIS